MNDKSVFDRLVSDLSQDERLKMISKMENLVPSTDMYLQENDPDEEYDYEKSYQSFSFFEKIKVFFTVLFSAKERESVIENLSMEKLARYLDRTSPGLINYSKKEFLNDFLMRLEKLDESLIIFRRTIATIMKTHESEFIAFMVGLHFPEIESALLRDIDPEKTAEANEFESSFQLKRHIEFRIDEILSEIDPDKKKIIYSEIKNLQVLNTLATFNFSNITSAFTSVEGDEVFTCSFIDIRKQLHRLLDILFSLNASPSGASLDSIFIFSNKMLNRDTEDNLEEDLENNLLMANTSMKIIGQFKSEIPLRSILCLVNRNMNFQPAHIGGGEDWYALFRRFWYKKFDAMMNRYIESEKRHNLEEEVAFFLKLPSKPLLKNYRDNIWNSGLNVKFGISSGFINSFISEIFMRDLVKPLKLVLIDGQFYKEQNRIDYNKSYRTITEVVGKLEKLDQSLGLAGENYHTIKEFELEGNDKEAVYLKTREVLSEVDSAFERVIKEFNAALGLLVDVLSGIVQGEMGGIYDTLSNLGYIGKGENKNLISQLSDIRFRLKEALNISYQLYDVERELIL